MGVLEIELGGDGGGVSSFLGILFLFDSDATLFKPFFCLLGLPPSRGIYIS